MLTRRTVLASAAVLVPLQRALAAAQEAKLTPADRADVARVEQYLDGIKTLQARFTQVAPDGAVSHGTAWLERPGRMRFQYDPPAPFLLIAAYGVLTFHDSSLQQTTNIPLNRTPLGILLSDDVKLSGKVTITSMLRAPGQIEMTLVRTETPGDGSLTLIFTEPPLALRQWMVVDAQQRETRVTLSDVRTGISIDENLFKQISVPGTDQGH
jgi:outer membrane lipoprotein-sorting protein